MAEEKEVSQVGEETTIQDNKWKKMREENTEHENTERVLESEDQVGEPVEPIEAVSDTSEAANAQHQEEVENLRKELQYLLADLQNANRRHRAERDNIKKYAPGEVIEAFFPLIDGLEAENQADQQEGRQHILDLMRSSLDKLGVKTLHPEVGEAFDPNLHAAIAKEKPEDENQADNTILKVVRKGYQLHDRVLRAAMVVVSHMED